MKVLVVDDADVARAAVCHQLKKNGVEFDEADCAAAASELIKANKYALILLDVNMPEKSGLELLADLKEEGVEFGPVAIISTEFSAEAKAEGKRLGVSAWVMKPLREGIVDKLIQKIAR